MGQWRFSCFVRLTYGSGADLHEQDNGFSS
jgi:hypothetical protein